MIVVPTAPQLFQYVQFHILCLFSSNRLHFRKSVSYSKTMNIIESSCMHSQSYHVTSLLSHYHYLSYRFDKRRPNNSLWVKIRCENEKRQKLKELKVILSKVLSIWKLKGFDTKWEEILVVKNRKPKEVSIAFVHATIFLVCNEWCNAHFVYFVCFSVKST